MLGRDGIAGLVVAATSLVLFALTLGLERNPLVPIGPAFYPRLVLGITAALGLLLLAQDVLRRRREAAGAARGARPNYALVAVSFAVFGGYVVLLPLLGFRLATFVFAAVLNLVLAPPRRGADWLRAAVVGVATALVTYYAFEGYLSVLLPRGSWTGF